MTISVPTDIAGCQLWLDGDDISTLYQDSGATTPVASDDDPVGYWGDKSGVGNHVTQATAGNRPTYKAGIQNSRDVLRFDGGDTLRRLDALGFSGNPAMTVFIVTINLPDLASAQYPLSLGGSAALGGQIIFFATSGAVASDERMSFRYNNGNQVFNNAVTTGSHRLMYQRIFGSNYQSGIAYLDGVAQTQTSSGSGTISPNLLNETTVVGDSYGGDIAEIIIYDTALSDIDREDVEDYLYNKWFVAAASGPVGARLMMPGVQIYQPRG